MAPVTANRSHTDEDIRVALSTAFKNYDIETMCIETLSCARITRPPNIHNVKRLVDSIADRRYMNKHEPVIAWDVAEGRRPVLWGTQRIHAANEYASRGIEPTFEVFAVLVKGLETPAPSKGDLEFASMEVMKFESLAAPRSAIAKIVEICLAFNYLVCDSRHLRDVRTADVLSVLPGSDDSEKHGDPYGVHWSRRIKLGHLRTLVDTARTFRNRGMEGLLDDVERRAHCPALQVSARYLRSVSDRELQTAGHGKQALLDFLSQLASNAKAVAVCKRVRTADETAVEHMEKGLERLHKGLTAWTKNHPEHAHSVSPIRDKLNSIGSDIDGLQP